MSNRYNVAGSAGQLDMGKALLFHRLFKFLFQLGNALPGFNGRRAGHSAQQSPLTDRLALRLAYRGHKAILLVDVKFYEKSLQLSPFSNVANAWFCGEKNK